MEDNIKFLGVEPDFSRFFKSERGKNLLESGCCIILADYAKRLNQIVEYENPDEAVSEFRQICDEYEKLARNDHRIHLKYPKRIYAENDEVDDGYIMEAWYDDQLVQCYYMINPEYY